jgi:non-ribosomal peptide synthetase component F
VEGVTLYVTILAAYMTLLHRYTGLEDVVVGFTDRRAQPDTKPKG